jgi:hypothetical protein
MVFAKRFLAAFLLLVLFLATGGCAMIDRMSGVADTKSLQETGIAAQGVIVRIWDTGITVNDDPVIGMEVEVYAAEGKPWLATIPKSLISRLESPASNPARSCTSVSIPRTRRGRGWMSTSIGRVVTELTRRLDDRDPASWVSLDEVRSLQKNRG